MVFLTWRSTASSVFNFSGYKDFGFLVKYTGWLISTFMITSKHLGNNETLSLFFQSRVQSITGLYITSFNLSTYEIRSPDFFKPPHIAFPLRLCLMLLNLKKTINVVSIREISNRTIFMLKKGNHA